MPYIVICFSKVWIKFLPFALHCIFFSKVRIKFLPFELFCHTVWFVFQKDRVLTFSLTCICFLKNQVLTFFPLMWFLFFQKDRALTFCLAMWFFPQRIEFLPFALPCNFFFSKGSVSYLFPYLVTFFKRIELPPLPCSDFFPSQKNRVPTFCLTLLFVFQSKDHVLNLLRNPVIFVLFCFCLFYCFIFISKVKFDFLPYYADFFFFRSKNQVLTLCLAVRFFSLRIEFLPFDLYYFQSKNQVLTFFLTMWYFFPYHVILFPYHVILFSLPCDTFFLTMWYLFPYHVICFKGSGSYLLPYHMIFFFKRIGFLPFSYLVAFFFSG